MPRFQSYRADCGPSALGNALEALEIRRSHDELVSLCRTTARDGTNHLGMLRAIRTIKESCELFGPVEMRDSASDVALLRLAHLLGGGRPAVLCVDSWSHWVAVVGVLGSRFVVADSADLRQTIWMGPEQLVSRWGYPGVRNGFYGIAL